MRRPFRCLLVLLAAAILGTGVPRVASADPVTITSGLISVPSGLTLPSPIQLQGADGVLPFSFVGFISSDSSIGVRTCNPCFPTATTISLGISTLGMDLPGTVSYGDDSYPVGGLADTVGNVYLFISGFVLLPPPPSAMNELATVMGSFQIDRAGFQPPISGGPFGMGNTLVGSGLATVSLFAEDAGHGVLSWSLRSAEYQFAPTPEPASFVLLGSGLAGLAMRRRKRR